MLVVVCGCFPEMGRQAAVDVFVGLFPPLLFVPKGLSGVAAERRPCQALCSCLGTALFSALRRGRCRRRAVAVGIRQHACLASASMHCGSLRARAAINIFMLKATAGVAFANDKTYNWLQGMAFCHVERAVLAAETARAAVRYVPFWGVEWHRP